MFVFIYLFSGLCWSDGNRKCGPSGPQKEEWMLLKKGIMMKERLEILKTNICASNLTILLVLLFTIISWRKDQFLSGSFVTYDFNHSMNSK